VHGFLLAVLVTGWCSLLNAACSISTHVTSVKKVWEREE
jgi:hypothetical protein